MSQAAFSTISSNDAQQIKYKKALRQISKLIESNRKLREENDINKRALEKQIQRLQSKCESAAAEAQIIRNQKQQLIKENQILRDELNSFEKQNESLEKQLKYVNDMLMDQKNYLKKYEMFQNQEKIGKILKTYEDMEQKHKSEVDILHQQIKDISSSREQKIKEVKAISQQKAQLQKKYLLLNEQIEKYRVLNLHLISQHQKIFNDENARRKFTEKQLQINNLILSLKTNIEKLTEFNLQKNSQRTSISQFELNLCHVTQQKLQLQVLNKKLQNTNQQLQEKLKKHYQQEEKISQYEQKILKLSEQCNMLKSKIIVLQVKNEELEEDEDFIHQTKEMQEKIQHLIDIGDPLQTIRNSDDTSHFRVLKNCIQTLRCKLELHQSKRKQIQKKYKILHAKYSKIHKGWQTHVAQVNLLKAKVQGYQRLTQKLQRELQKNIIIHDNHIKQLQIRNREQLKKKSSQVQLSLNKYRKDNETFHGQHERSLKRQVQTLRQKLSSQSIKCENALVMLKKNQQLIQLSKKRQNQYLQQIQQIKKENLQIREQCEKYKKSFTEEKIKNEQLITLKDQVESDYKRVAKRLSDRQSTTQEKFKVCEQQYQLKIRKLQTQILKITEQKEFFEKQAIHTKRQFEEYRKNFDFDLQQFNKQTQNNAKLQQELNKVKSNYQELLNQNDFMKVKINRYSQDHQKVKTNEKQKTNKDEAMQQLRINIRAWESKYNILEMQLKKEKQRNSELNKQLDSLYLTQSKHSQNQKSTSTAQSQLKQQRQRNAKLMSQIESINQQLLKIQGSYENLYSSEISQKNIISSLQNEISLYRTITTQFEKKCQTLQREILQVEQFFQDVENYVSYLNSIIQGPQFQGKNLEELRAQDRILQLIKCLKHIKQSIYIEHPPRRIRIATSTKFDDDGESSELIYHGRDYQISINSDKNIINVDKIDEKQSTLQKK